MKKVIIIVTLALLLVALGYATYFIYNNTSFFRVSDQINEVEENNQNILSTEEISQGEMHQVELDLLNLVAQELAVDDKYKTGVFADKKILNLPKDFKINLFAGGLDAPRFMSFDDEGNLFVADKGAGIIYLLKDSNGDGVADNKIVVDSGLKVIHSVYYYQSDLYAAEEDKVLKFNSINADGKYLNKEILVDNLPTDGGHSTRTVIVGPDKKLYISIGSSCNICEESDERRAAVVRYNLDGSGEEIFASGLRNSVGIQFYQNKLWGINNGRDLIGDNVPPEEVNIIEQGKNYGWPYCYGMGIVSPEYPDRDSYCLNETQNPAYEMQAHSAPLGLDFLPEDNNFPENLKDNMFIGFHGSWNRTVPTGYKVVRLDVNNNDAQTINFVTGWLQPDASAWGRPVDVEFSNRGNMYISDDRAGAIYRVTYIK